GHRICHGERQWASGNPSGERHLRHFGEAALHGQFAVAAGRPSEEGNGGGAELCEWSYRLSVRPARRSYRTQRQGGAVRDQAPFPVVKPASRGDTSTSPTLTRLRPPPKPVLSERKITHWA